MAKGGVGCELCGGAARIYCESDRASLCWGCDHKVHGANFLVGKHSRTLLCHRCQSPTPWTSSGSRIPPCMSLCLACISLVSTSSNLVNSNQHPQAQPQQPQLLESSSPHDDQEEEEEGYGTYSDDDDDDEDDDVEDEEEEEEEEEEDDENQVVPWTSDDPAMSASNSSGSKVDEDEDEIGEEEDDSNAKTSLFSSPLLKRKRDSVFLHSSHRNTLPRL